MCEVPVWRCGQGKNHSCLNLILWLQQVLCRDVLWLDLGFILITVGCIEGRLKGGNSG